jgi:hypothetical protein
MVLCAHGKKVAQAIRGWTCKRPYLLFRTSFGVSLEESKAIGALFHVLSVRIQQVSAWVHEALSSGLQLKRPAAANCHVPWRPDVDRYTTDLVLGVAIREGFFTCWR